MGRFSVSEAPSCPFSANRCSVAVRVATVPAGGFCAVGLSALRAVFRCCAVVAR
ncbi:hypothetical protein [Streptosporangium sp. NPDC006007]|uniref:hypothetical protein n=1 Tax=Streptosporangium sp. NPDC006007 TaxID=3154575 RepID=UPI0033A7E5F9